MPERGSREPQPEVLLFDVGGVLVELGPSPLPGGADLGPDEWLRSSIALDFEKGLTGAEEFAASLIAGLDLDCDVAAVIDHFRRWPIGVFPGVPALLSRTARDYRVAMLTNTNELHWPRMVGEFELGRYAERIFASHRLGMAKPEAAIFRHVVEELGTPAQRILFIDDNLANVEAARAAGFRAEQVGGFEPMLQRLAALEIIDPAEIAAIAPAAGLPVRDSK